MFLTEEENRKLTEVGQGTPGGELLRRYWHPIVGLHQLTGEAPTAHVRILGEDLVLFHDKSGRVGLLADHCPHRGASLLYGRVEERGLACAYHGWLYDTQGNCLETPAEPNDSKLYLTVKHRAYPVQKLLGLYWAYLGPEPVPPIRRFDASAYPVQHIMEMTYAANWVQAVENTVDGTHIYVLHQDTSGTLSGSVRSTTRGLLDQLTSLDYQEGPAGIERTMTTADGAVEDDPVVFPLTLRRVNSLVIHVPIDDTHTRKFVVFLSTEKPIGDDPLADEPVDYYIMPPEDGKSGVGHYPDVRYQANKLRFQDVMAIETQGTIADRTAWHPGTADRGVALFERMVLREMDRVQTGFDPIGVSRDPNLVVDTKYEAFRAVGGVPPQPAQGIRVYERRRAVPT
jgi:5,5'-dehydrodivanillate O-demethylase